MLGPILFLIFIDEGLSSAILKFADDTKVYGRVDCWEDSGVFRISKRGAKFSLATSAHTKGGAKPSFPIFLVCQKKFFLAKGGAMAQWPP